MTNHLKTLTTLIISISALMALPIAGCGKSGPAAPPSGSSSPTASETAITQKPQGNNLALQIKCSGNMKMIGAAILRYKNDHDNAFPSVLGVLIEDPSLTMQSFICPMSGHSAPTQKMDDSQEIAWINANSDYDYFGGGLPADGNPNIILLAEKSDHSNADGIYLLYEDGSVKYVNKDEAKKDLQLSEKARNQ